MSDAIQLAPDGSNWREVREFLIDQHYAYSVHYWGGELTGYTGALKYTDRFNIRPGQWVTVSSRDRGSPITVTEEDPRG
jgi:hypothetical protein